MLSAGIRKVIALGASTGGVEALEQVLSRFPITVPPVVLAIHMQPGITKLYADQLDDQLDINVKEAQTGDLLAPGQILIAPAGKHMKVVSRLGKLSVECYVGERVQFAIPSVDVLFESVAKEVRQNAIGAILTGIGADGARGLLKMKEAGARTFGQDEDTCAVYGMPKVAFEMGAVQEQLPLNQIAGKILASI